MSATFAPKATSSTKAKAAPAKEKLPVWDLTHFYAAHDDAQVAKDIAKLSNLSSDFAKQYKGKIGKLDSAALTKALKTYESMKELEGKLSSYAYLLYATDMTNPSYTAFYQNTLERLTSLSTLTLFFSIELNGLDEKVLQHMLKEDKALAKFAPVLRDVRVFKPYQLPEEQEKLLHEKSVTGSAAWVRLYDETQAAMVFPLGKKKLNIEQITDMLASPKREERAAAAKVFSNTLQGNAKLSGLITNTLAKDKAIEDEWRGFAAPISSRNLANYVEDEVVDALMQAVRAAYPRLSHRYYALKAKWLGLKKLEYWDRNAPLPGARETRYTWAQGREVVLSAYRDFSPKMADVAQRFFDENWLDAEVRPGKSPGAFSHPTVPSVHPYILMHYQGKTRDVMTLAHELGHGVHQVLSGKQGALMADTPLTLAETASVFGEQLTFQKLLAREKSKKAKHLMIASKVEDMLNTVVRQIAFCDFEIRLHNARKQGELSPEAIGELWMAAQKESLGSAVNLRPEYSIFWSYIPHFIHSPFYVYAYAFGDCLVNALYAVYAEEAAKGRGADFVKKYHAMLEAGGTMWHKELLKPFGLDASQPSFWLKGLSVIEGFIDELEENAEF